MFPLPDVAGSSRAQWPSSPDVRSDGAIEACVDNPDDRSNVNRQTEEMMMNGVTYTRLDSTGALDSVAVTNLVPIQTPAAPYMKDAATPRPSQMPPAATSCTAWPVKGDLYFRTKSAQAGNRILPQYDTSKYDARSKMEMIPQHRGSLTHLVGISPVWPPASDPWAQMISAPAAQALMTCFGWPTRFI